MNITLSQRYLVIDMYCELCLIELQNPDKPGHSVATEPNGDDFSKKRDICIGL